MPKITGRCDLSRLAIHVRRVLAAVLLLCCGCQTIVTPPAHVSDPVEVYLTDYGRHASIVLPAQAGGYDEFAFGDWDFFARGDTKWWVAARAMLGSRQATLGRRHLTAESLQAGVANTLGARRLMHFFASKQRVDALRENLHATFVRAGMQPFQSDYSMLEHVPVSEHYWGLHNCNHVTAAWLQRLGCTIDGPATWSNFVIDPSPLYSN